MGPTEAISEEETLFVMLTAFAADAAGVCRRASLWLHCGADEVAGRTRTPGNLAEILPDGASFVLGGRHGGRFLDRALSDLLSRGPMRMGISRLR